MKTTDDFFPIHESREPVAKELLTVMRRVQKDIPKINKLVKHIHDKKLEVEYGLGYSSSELNSKAYQLEAAAKYLSGWAAFQLERTGR
jgi:hypothetical protein